jgi:hypothetical protein
MSDTVRIIGFENDISVVQAIKPQVIDSATPVLSAAIDTRTYARDRILLVAQVTETTPTDYTVTFAVTESATSAGVYTAATTSGTLTAVSADAIEYASIKRNPAKPFIKITATGSNADVDQIVSASVLFIADAI